MLTKKNINKILLFFCITVFTSACAQKPAVYKIDQLTKRIFNNSDTTYVVNFWATWCKPCVAELPEFEKLHVAYKDKKIKVILVSMDFVEEIDKKLKDFLDKNKYTCEVVLLDEINGNDFINQISQSWSGAIPATLVVKPKPRGNDFYEGKITAEKLASMIFAK
jgi:thiol-disulfide isomerase/thioredoxin